MRPLGNRTHHYWLAMGMAKTAGADLVAAMEEGSLSQQGWADLVERCRACPWAEGCARWLPANVAAGASPPRICMNRRAFETLDGSA